MPEPINYAAILPEITLACGSLALLMFGAFSGTHGDKSEKSGWLAILIMGLAGYFVVTQEGSAEAFKGAFVADSYARFMKIVILGSSATALLLSFDYLRRAKLLTYEFPVLVLLATTGMMMMVSANDLISLYLALELQNLALYVLAAIRRHELRSSEAGLKYFVLGALSSGMVLYGASLLYGVTGTTSFAGLAAAAQAPGAAANIGLIVGLVFLLAGLAFKISAVPFHMWTPDVYEGAPTPVTAFFATATKIAAMALIVRALYSAFPGIEMQWRQIVVFLAIASMLLGAFAAIGQTNIKRLMAYSSIGHVGFVLVGVAAADEAGLQSLFIYLAIYAVMTLGSFACILSMRREEGMVEDIYELGGFAKTNLGVAFVFAMLLFSLAGVPPLAGFFAKFYAFAAAVKAGLYPLAVLGVLTSVVSAFYYLRIIKVMFFDEAKQNFCLVEPYTRAVVAAAGLFVIFFAAYPSFVVDAAMAAAQSFGR